ncbi:hypothetical protein [Chryseobacterium turcicum]|uniref:DUF3592 domain-containing protein n=1 Tax=Chryseobacterium turcicum TaxID=2898076 RepID=A0A9Q3V5K6_9FLAO|nr:hypothetical protein [Chryseobacterium turcicum]MCD1117725.1 hypothetical protein [Chryseobacterium turcicum]
MNKRIIQKKDKFIIFKRILVVLILLFFSKELMIYQPILNLFETQKVIAKIINEKNGMRKSHLTGDFVYSYSFEYQGKEYKNESDNENFLIGEELTVEFNPTFPFINRIYKSRFTE